MASATLGLAWCFLASGAGAELLPSVLDRDGDGRIVVACLGDSNTDSSWQNEKRGGFPPGSGWCEQLVASLADPRIHLVNLAIGGATVGHNATGSSLRESWRWIGDGQLRVAVEQERSDLVLLAFGTNDVLPAHGHDPGTIVDAYNRLMRQLRARNVIGFVALTPPVQRHARSGSFRRSTEAIAETNTRLREVFPHRLLLDFYSDPTAEDFLDDLHLNASGQAKRAREAHQKIAEQAAVTSPPAGVRALRFSRGHWAPPVSAARPGTEAAVD